MPIYEYQGKSYDIDSTNPDEAKAKILKHLESQRVESNMPKPVEGEGGAAFGVYRPQGRRPESQQNREASKEMPIQTARGVVTGTLGAIPDILNLPGTIYSGVTGNEAPYKVPLGSEEWNQMLPFQSDTPQARLARFGGEVLAPVPTIKGVKAIAKAPGQMYQTGKEFTQGAMEGLRNPVYQRNSQTAFAPLEQTYYPTPEVQAFQNATAAERPGMLPQLEASQQTSSSLFNSPTELLASALGPKTAQGQNLIPFQGETTRAFGETVGRDIATEPFKTAGIPSIAGATIGGIVGGPIGAMAGAGLGAVANPLLRAAELYSLNKLGKTAGFTRGFPEQLTQARFDAQAPQTPLLTNQASGPVNPATMYVAPEGVAGTNINQVSQAGAQQKYAPQPIAQTPAQQSQQMAAQKLQEVQQPAPVDPAMLAKQQAIQEQIRQRALQQKQPQVAPVETPAQTQSSSMFESLPGSRWSEADKLALQRANLQQNPSPAMSAADEASMAKQVAESQKSSNDAIISDFATKGNSEKIDMIGQTIPVDMGKDAFNASNATRGMATYLLKNGVDSIPILPGMTEAQTVHAIAEQMKGINRTGRGNPEIRTSKTINNELNALDEKMTALRDDALENKLKPDTPENETYRKQLSELNEQAKTLQKELEAAQKAEKKASKSAPKNVSKMMTEGPNGTTVYKNKEEFDKASIFNTLKNEPPTGSYLEGNKIITHEPIPYTGWPADWVKSMNMPQTKITATDAKTGERVPVGKTWTDADPEPLTERVKTILNRRKK